MAKKRNYFTQADQKYWRSTYEKTGKKRGQTILEWMQQFLGGR